MGFQRSENDKQQKLNWRWQVRMDDGMIVIDLLTDALQLGGGKVG